MQNRDKLDLCGPLQPYPTVTRNKLCSAEVSEHEHCTGQARSRIKEVIAPTMVLQQYVVLFSGEDILSS